MDNGTHFTQIQDGPDPRTISFDLLRVSDAGKYTCRATIRSNSLNSSLIRSGSRDVMVLSELCVLIFVIVVFDLAVTKFPSTNITTPLQRV